MYCSEDDSLPNLKGLCKVATTSRHMSTASDDVNYGSFPVIELGERTAQLLTQVPARQFGSIEASSFLKKTRSRSRYDR